MNRFLLHTRKRREAIDQLLAIATMPPLTPFWEDALASQNVSA
jgi:hypothetical protein